MEALKAEANLEVAGRRMRELQARWKPVALAPRAQGEVMWRRFKTAQDEVYARTSAHFAAQNEERAGNLARKQTLCEKAEALADSTDWVKTATEIQSLQAEWKGIGPVTRGHEKAIWERFRAACDRFFTRGQEDLKRRKEEWAGNLARKEALCAKAEALADSMEWESAAAQFKQLQAEWKTIGPVRKSRSEAIWQRFRAACDRFFDRFKHRDQVELQEKAAVRDTVIRELGRWCRPTVLRKPGARQSLHDHPAGEGQMAAGAGVAARAPAGSGREVSPGGRPARGNVARGVCQHRSRSRDDTQAHGKAAGSRRRDRFGAVRAASQSVADGVARAAIARSPRRQHHGRGRRSRCRERGIALARVRAGSA